MRPSKSILFLLTALTMVACDDDGSGPNVEAPTLTYAQAAHVTPFFESGSTAAPTIEWNGETGTLALADAVAGVTVDASTGVVSWDVSVAIGVNAVEVVATNSAGADTVALEIDNQFQGHFEGGSNNDPESGTLTADLEMTFSTDGTVTALAGESSQGEGTWTRDGTTITAVLSADGGSTFDTVEGDVTHDANEAVLEGFWYNGSEPTEGGEQGIVRVTLVPPAA